MIITTMENGTEYRIYISNIREAVAKCGTDILNHAVEISPAEQAEIRLIEAERRQWLEARYLSKITC
jgi:hypothetical protein